MALVPSQLLDRHGSAALHPPEEKADAVAVSSHWDRIPTLKTTSSSFRAEELHERGLEEPPELAVNPQARDRNDARLPRMDETVSVCMLELALLNSDDAENTRLEDVFKEHQRDGSHCSERHSTRARRCVCGIHFPEGRKHRRLLTRT